MQLVKRFGSLFNGHLMTIAKSVLILVLLFHQKEARNKLSSTKSFKELSNWYGGNLTKQGDMVIKIATHTFIGKSLDKFSSHCFRVEFIMSLWVWLKGESIEKIMNVLFKRCSFPWLKKSKISLRS